MVVNQEFAALLAQVILAASSLIMAIFKYRELIDFLYGGAKWLLKPIMGAIRWIKLARKLEIGIAENKNDIESGRREIDDVRKSIAELTSFIKEKLTKNGGSSIFDAIKRIEERQMASDSRQSALLNDSKNGYFFCDLHGKNSWVNRTYARLLDCGTNELLGFGWRKFIKTEELARYSKIWENAFKDGCEFEETVDFVNAHNQRIGLHISVSAVQNEKGETVSYIGQVTAL